MENQLRSHEATSAADKELRHTSCAVLIWFTSPSKTNCGGKLSEPGSRQVTFTSRGGMGAF